MRVVKTPTGVAFEIPTGLGGLGPPKLVEFFRHQVDGGSESGEPSGMSHRDLIRSKLSAFEEVLLSKDVGFEHKRIVAEVLTNDLLNVLSNSHESSPDGTTSVIVAHLAELPERGEMRTQTLKALKSLYRFACARELVPQAVDPAGRLRIRRRAPGPVNALEPEELERLLAAAEAIDPRARPALELAYATGARLGSLCAIMPADVGLGTVKLLETKGDRPYEVPLGDRGRRAAARLLELIDYTPPTVLTRRPTLVGVGPGRVWQWTNAAAQRAGLKASPHTLRRTFGTRLAENPDVDVRSWIELMGHADGSQMRRYAKASDTRLRAAVEGL